MPRPAFIERRVNHTAARRHMSEETAALERGQEEKPRDKAQALTEEEQEEPRGLRN